MTQPDTVSLTLQDLYRARAAIAGRTVRTPLMASPSLSRIAGSQVHLKLETLQPTGAFKLRGATNRLASLSEQERRRGVVTVSTGNHARAVAHAAKTLGVSAQVFMSELVPGNKVDAVRALGADVVIGGRSQDEADEAARAAMAETGRVMVPPFDDPWVIAGQGTIGLELLEDLPDIDTALVCLSGGGLIAGIALALKTANPAIRVVGISMDRGAAMHESLKAGRPVSVEEVASLADSLGGGIGLENRWTFRMCQQLLDDTVLVTEDEIAAGMRHLFLEDRVIAEGGASVGAAAILAGKTGRLGKTSAVIVSGNGVDMARFTEIVAGRH